MKYSPISGTLRTDNGEFVKVLDCPIGVTQRNLVGAGRLAACRVCNKSVVRIDGMSDATVLELFSQHPEQCISLSLDGPNMEVVFDVSRF